MGPDEDEEGQLSKVEEDSLFPPVRAAVFVSVPCISLITSSADHPPLALIQYIALNTWDERFLT